MQLWSFSCNIQKFQSLGSFVSFHAALEFDRKWKFSNSNSIALHNKKEDAMSSEEFQISVKYSKDLVDLSGHHILASN